MSAHCDEELVETALLMALARRRPQVGLLHHSDRGSQYTSRAYRQLVQQSGMIVSMSRKGNCWDNATMESFFGTLKKECVGSTTYLSYEEARQALFIYLETFYNRIRRHSTLGYVSPYIYEQRREQNVHANVGLMRSKKEQETRPPKRLQDEHCGSVDEQQWWKIQHSEAN